ncbi:MAG: enoyl-CoA hydratase/isomerase family protein [Candidatus Dormibacteraeota bacterium]|nr:enoyl-CoA hydratase/isomerase family protein [Candidatus Dormibacteraeota bacterium]
MQQFTDILVTKEGGIARIVIDRPDVLNALRSQTYAELTAAFTEAADDDEVGVVVLSGAGDRAFSSGGDVRGQAERTPASGRRHLRRMIDLAAAIRNNGKPVIAAVDGYAIGGGHELHLMCDMTIATDRSEFGQVGPRVGSVPIWGATQLLPRLVGEKRAREMIFLCRRYSAREAYEMGLVNKVVPPGELDAEVDSWCQDILDKSPQSLRIAKTSLNFESDQLAASYTHGLEMLSLTYGNDENLEGVRAFLEKRAPDFRRFRSRGAAGG